MKKILTESWTELTNLVPGIGSKKEEAAKDSKQKQELGKDMQETPTSPEARSNDQPELNNEGTIPNGWFGSYYIGPTCDAVMEAMPTPVHAADYIAQQHDLEYQELGLNGVSGTLDPRSSEADRRLIVRCNELIHYYEQGITTYHGYEITPQAYQAALYMREYFVVEESISDFFHKTIK